MSKNKMTKINFEQLATKMNLIKKLGGRVKANKNQDGEGVSFQFKVIILRSGRGLFFHFGSSRVAYSTLHPIKMMIGRIYFRRCQGKGYRLKSQGMKESPWRWVKGGQVRIISTFSNSSVAKCQTSFQEVRGGEVTISSSFSHFPVTFLAFFFSAFKPSHLFRNLRHCYVTFFHG